MHFGGNAAVNAGGNAAINAGGNAAAAMPHDLRLRKKKTKKSKDVTAALQPGKIRRSKNTAKTCTWKKIKIRRSKNTWKNTSS